MLDVMQLSGEAIDHYRKRLGELRGEFEAIRADLSPEMIEQIELTFLWLEQPDQESRAALEHVMEALGLQQ